MQETRFTIFRQLGHNANEEELKAMINEFDLDGDGESRRLLFFSIE